MIFQAPPAILVGVPAAAVAAAGVLTWEEWRRPDRRRLPWRVGAALLAVLALALLGLRPAWRAGRTSPGRDGTAASLYTPGGQPPPAVTALRFSLPLPGTVAPPDAVVLTDVAALRRNFPRVGTLHVYGDGLEPFDLDALRGLRVLFQPPAAPAAAAVTFLRCPRELPLGAPLELQGRVDGLPPGATAALTLAAPDGSTTEAATSPAGRDGSAAFTLRGPAPRAVGRFDWRLRLTRGGASDDPLGIAVVRPALPRVLVLETTPRFDTSALRRWFEQAGGALAARTQVGKDLYRFFGPPAGNGSAPGEFTVVDGPLLAGYDLVLADGHSLLALTDPERAALRAAVVDNGLGVLTLADDAVLPAVGSAASEAAKSPAAALLPWTLRSVNGGAGSDEPAAENADRSVRLRWPGMSLPMNAPAQAAPWEIVLPSTPAQTPLIRDDQGRAVAAAAPLGRGRLALTLVRETGRWNRTEEPAAFAAYWSHLFSELARPDETDGRWSLADGEAGPVRVDEPLELVWQGASTAPLAPAVITDSTGAGATLPFIQDAAEPTRWRITFWPRRSGWRGSMGVVSRALPEGRRRADGWGCGGKPCRRTPDNESTDGVGDADALDRTHAGGPVGDAGLPGRRRHRERAGHPPGDAGGSRAAGRGRRAGPAAVQTYGSPDQSEGDRRGRR